MIKTLVADDHPVVRQGIKQILAQTTDIIVADEAKNGREVLDKIRRDTFDLVLLDISMPDRDGLETLIELKKRYPKLSVLILSMYTENQCGLQALRAGADGYLTKDNVLEELLPAIRKVTTGKKYVSATLAERLVDGLHAPVDRLPHELLSRREYQIMCMIASGKTPTDIAEELSLAVNTVGSYRKRVLDKMHMENNAEITRYVIKNGLVK